MTQFYDLMVDVECLGKSETAALLSIGAVFFDLNTCTLGPTFQRAIHLATAMRDGGTVDAGTILWWMGQGEKARNGVRFGGQDIRTVLSDFSDFIGQTCRTADVRPWGNSAAFDLPKIRTAYERIGATTPWHWVNERDFRTARAMHPAIIYDPKEKGDDAHEALADAVFQAQHLFKIKNRNKQ